jgi:F-type H+-transporting ATPase subunit a
MQKIRGLRALIAPVLLLQILSSFAGEHETPQADSTAQAVSDTDAHHSAAQVEEKFRPDALIMSHISDAHDWHLWDFKDENGVEHPVGIPLPVIIWDGGLHMFSSARFNHGHDVVSSNGNEYLIHKEKIYKTDAEGSITFDKQGNVLNEKPLDLSITKNVAALLVSAVLMLLIFIGVARSYARSLQPGGVASFVEPIIVFVRDDIARPNIGEHHYRKFMGYLLTVFFFIWINNLLGLIPIFPGGANLTGNIAVTMTLAGMTLLITNFSGNRHYWGHIFKPPGVPWWLLPIMIVVELIGVLSKPFALMIRLFANISAGHIIILSLISLIFIFKSIAFAPISMAFVLFMNTLELLVAALQAYIFTLLSALFIGQAIAVPEHH